jgi:hypothetical protein
MKTTTKKRRVSSGKVVIPGGSWSVRTPTGFSIEGTSENLAWGIFVKTVDDAELINAGKVMAARKSIPPPERSHP